MGAWWLLAWVLTFAAWLLMHLALGASVLASREPMRPSRWWVLVPPAVPFVAWAHGRRRAVWAWAFLGATYVAMRALA